MSNVSSCYTGAVPGLAAVLAAVLAGSSPASAAYPTPSPPHGTTGTETIRLVARQTQAVFLRLGLSTKKPSLGDEEVYAEDLYLDGRKIGDHGVVCTYVHISPDELQCLGTFDLPHGQIAGQALLSLPATPTVNIAITGGTGAYRGARGYVHTVPAGTAQRQLTFRIIRLYQGDDVHAQPHGRALAQCPPSREGPCNACATAPSMPPESARAGSGTARRPALAGGS